MNKWVVIAIVLALFMPIAIGIIQNARKGIADEQNCFLNYAKYYCLKNNMTIYSYDPEGYSFTCWKDKAKGEKKTFYSQEGVCK